MGSSNSRPHRFIRHVSRLPLRLLILITVVAVVLIAARVALPFVLERLINDRLARVPGYTGSVADIDVALIRGAYAIDGIAIYRTGGEVKEPFVLVDNIDFSLAWRELWHGKVVSEIYVDRGRLNFTQQPAVTTGFPRREETPTRDDTGPGQWQKWNDLIEDLFPISITHLEIRDSLVRYKDVTKEPHVDVFIRNMHGIATGLRNRPEETGLRYPANISIEGETIGRGGVELKVEADPLADQPDFHLSVMIAAVHLPALNDSLRAIANVDVGKGTFHVVAEMVAENGAFNGYVKPFFEDLEYADFQDRSDGVFTRIWENIVAALSWLMKNKSRDELATKMPFEGRFGDPNVGLLATLGNLFRHAFVQPFNPTLDGMLGDDSGSTPPKTEPGSPRNGESKI